MKENYIVSARKYRPATFDTVVGQQALTHTLKTAIMSERLAHAYLFCGPRGVGKTTCARIFAKAINCEHLGADGEPCNECESCKAFNEQRSYNIVELDAASNNSVEDIRKITDQVRIPPQVGRYRVFIIDEVHMLSTQAFNAFLKTLEEPPEYAIFILATTEKQKIIPTILSRCQIYDFARITVPDIVRQLQQICGLENVEAEPSALNVIAQKADGAMRDALSIFDQVVASSQGKVTYQATIENLNVLDHDYYFRLDEAFLNSDVPSALLIYKEIRDHGFDSQFFINGLAQHLRDLMVASTPATASLLEMNEDVAQLMVQQAAKFSPRFFYAALDLCNTCDLNYRDASSKMLLVELTLIKLCQLINPVQPVEQAKPAALKQVAQSKQQPQQAAPARPQAPAAPQPQAQAAPQPQAQAAPQPQAPAPMPQASAAPAPAPARHPAPSAKPVMSSRVLIHGQAKAAAPVTSNTPAPTKAHETQSFTPEQLLDAWNLYIMRHPNEQVVINTMRMSPPERVNDTQYEIYVDSTAQLEFMTSMMGEILKFLRNEVKNDMLAIDIKIRESAPKARVMTDRELVEEIKSRHPEFVEMINDFGLGLM
ncbi:MAG: DNA polymerase III subunit gamma/tau [Muribaculaceae bacterium]|nr:DNA polymerase III subunit gamma/tau [Muribaculaceae bacterium]